LRRQHEVEALGVEQRLSDIDVVALVVFGG
jgi:hypothetical protein